MCRPGSADFYTCLLKWLEGLPLMYIKPIWIVFSNLRTPPKLSHSILGHFENLKPCLKLETLGIPCSSFSSPPYNKMTGPDDSYSVVWLIIHLPSVWCQLDSFNVVILILSFSPWSPLLNQASTFMCIHLNLPYLGYFKNSKLQKNINAVILHNSHLKETESRIGGLFKYRLTACG